MLPKILKNFNVYVDGRGYAGKVEEITLPKLTIKTEEFLGAGMSAPIEIDLGMEKMEMEFTFVEYDSHLFRLFGLTNGSEVAFTVRGAIQSNSDPESVIINVRGFIKEMDSDTWKPAEKSTLKLSITCSYYRLSIAGVELIEIDPINMVRKVGESDQLMSFRQILQI